MLSRLLLLAAFLFGFRAGSAERLQAVTFNTGLLSVAGVDLVSCVDERIEPQIESLDQLLKPPFVLSLQEVWTPRAFNAFRDWAENRGYNVVYNDPKKDGLLIITSESVTGMEFRQFQRQGWNETNGVLMAQISWLKRPVIVFTSHTLWSSKEAVDPIHASQLAELVRIMNSFGLASAVMVADLNSGPDVQIRGQRYDPVQKIWQELFLNQLNPNWIWSGRNVLQITWDQGSNPLVIRPPRLLKLFGILDDQGGWGWSSSQLDHIFVTSPFKILESHRTLVQAKLKTRCSTASEFLSDHYGWEVNLEFGK